MSISDRGRFSAKRKRDAVLRLLRGEDLDLLSRELGVTGASPRPSAESPKHIERPDDTSPLSPNVSQDAGPTEARRRGAPSGPTPALPVIRHPS